MVFQAGDPYEGTGKLLLVFLPPLMPQLLSEQMLTWSLSRLWQWEADASSSQTPDIRGRRLVKQRNLIPSSAPCYTRHLSVPPSRPSSCIAGTELGSLAQA